MLAKDQTLGKYKILDRLGSGGFGTVYLALDTWVNRKVALKVPHQQQEEVVDLLKEPRIMALLKHPNIVELITVERKNGIFFMVLEYVDGESLDRMIRKERFLAPPMALSLAIDVCTAIAFAHGHQILHRDLRPANILVTKEGVAKVTDFGTSRELDMKHVPFAPTRIGSPPYMAPEHFRGRAVFQSDLWSMGITLYEMLTGTVPFYDADPLKIAQAFTSQQIVPPHLKNPAVPKAFGEVVMKALSVNLGDRYLSAHAMLEALLKLRESVARETRPLGTAIMANTGSSGPHPTYRSLANPTQAKLCAFCFKSLPRGATRCPSCGEKA
ncbi:MAG TPA: serine/threonine-protein kinase [Holophagaceae bacterium]|nr:serine/threonine-protein kinase [Holophagaceae bacterium]